MAKLQVQAFAKIPNEYISIERSRSLSLLEEKLVYMLINAMQKRWESTKKLEQIDFKFIASGTVSFTDFRRIMQISSKDNKELLASLKVLFNFTLYVNHIGITDFVHLFERMKVDETTLTINYQFHNCFLEYFTGICRDYFKLSVEEVVGLNSTYSIRIYQALKTKQNMDKHEFEYSIIELKKLLNIENKYNQYSHIKQKILEPSKLQINSSEASQFNIDYEEIKTGKAVTTIRFHVLPKGKNYYQEKNLIAGYKLDQIVKQCNKWKKEFDKNDVVYILADKILSEAKLKNPNRNIIVNYLDGIHTITNQKKLV